MADHPNIGQDLFGFARAIVLHLVKDRRLVWDDHHIEDASQDLFLAG
jgi:hypothetical protein